MTTATQEQSARAFLADLREEILQHPGVGHSLLSRMHTDPRTKHDFKILATQHYPLVANFCAYMELLLVRAPNSEAKCWIAKVLVDEYGERSDDKDHAEMYRAFMNATGISEDQVGDFPLHPEVQHFVNEHYRIATEEPFLTGLGAIGPGHEWAIPTMFTHAVKGLRKAGFEEDEILYWTCHLDQDEDHGAWLEEALVNYCDTEEHRQQIRRGAILSLDARERFWWGVLDKINTELTKAALPGVAPAANENDQLSFNQLKERLKIKISVEQ